MIWAMDMSKIKKALQKAKEKREIYSHPTSITSKDMRKMASEDGVFQEKMLHAMEGEKYLDDSDEFKVTYTKTQVHPVDPEILRSNKIVSLFHDHEMTDQINLLRAQVMNSLKKIGGNSLLITSANPGEGKTFTAINLGISIAKELDRTVLLIDADLKNPTIHHYDFASDFFGVNIKKGLADYLLGQAELPDLLINPGIEKLTILPAGRALPNSSELLGSQRMEAMINEIKGRYQKKRIVIFDCSSILASPDPLVFSHLVDSILFVIEAEKTTPNQIKRAMELINGRHVLGTVLNKKTG